MVHRTSLAKAGKEYSNLTLGKEGKKILLIMSSISFMAENLLHNKAWIVFQGLDKSNE